MRDNLQSEQLDKLAEALAKAQATIKTASYDSKNPHFKSDYASYESIRKACQEPLATNGLSIVHLLDSDQTGRRTLITQLLHTSGQWVRSFLSMPQEKETPQSLGSAISYAKRYALSALLCIGTGEDDDGESAEEPFRNDAGASAAKTDPAPKERISSPPGPKQIGKEKATILAQLIGSDQVLLGNILKHYKIESLEQINIENYQFVLKDLQARAAYKK